MKKTVLMSAAKKARIALAVLAVCGFTFAGAQSAFGAYSTTDLPVKTDAKNNIICGNGAKVENTSTQDAIVMGNGAVSSCITSIVIGFNAKATNTDPMNFGFGVVAIGASAEANCSNTIALGHSAKASTYHCTAVGAGAVAQASGSVSLGSDAKANGLTSIAIGWSARAEKTNSVAIGCDSIADDINTVSLGGKHKMYQGIDSVTGEIIYTDYWLKRRITNVDDGKADSDAATVGQVKSMIAAGGAGSTLTQEQFNTMLDANTKFTGLQTEVGNKANANGDNITTGAGSEWANKLGTGAIANGNKNLVNGETVYNKIGDTSQLENANLGNNLSDAVMTVNTKADNALNKAKDNEKKIGDTSKLTAAGLGDNLSDAVVNVNNKVGTADELKALKDAGLGDNLAQATAAVNKKADKNAEDIKTVNGRVDELGGRVSKLDSKVNKVGAGAAALAALHPMEFDSDNKLTFAAGVGSYHGASAAAIGAFYRPSEQVMFSIAGNMGNGENMVNAGVSFALDRPSKTPTTKAMMAKKLAEQEQMLAEQSREIAELKAMVQQLAAKQNA